MRQIIEMGVVSNQITCTKLALPHRMALAFTYDSASQPASPPANQAVITTLSSNSDIGFVVIYFCIVTHCQCADHKRRDSGEPSLAMLLTTIQVIAKFAHKTTFYKPQRWHGILHTPMSAIVTCNGVEPMKIACKPSNSEPGKPGSSIQSKEQPSR